MIRPAALFLALLWPLTGHAGDRPEQPSAWFCIKARAHRALYPTDKAAEDAAIAQGASRTTIDKAHRCPR